MKPIVFLLAAFLTASCTPTDVTGVPCATGEQGCTDTFFSGVNDLTSGRVSCVQSAECVQVPVQIDCPETNRTMDGCPSAFNREFLDDVERDLDVLRERMCSPCYDGCASFASCAGGTPACVAGECQLVPDDGTLDGG